MPLLMRLAATIRRPSSEAVHTEPVTRPSPSGGERAGIARLTMNPNYLVLADNARKKMRSSLTSAPAHHAAPPSCRRSSRSVDSTGTAPHADARDWQSTGVGGGSRAPCRARGGLTRGLGRAGTGARTHAPARRGLRPHSEGRRERSEINSTAVEGSGSPAVEAAAAREGE